MFYGLFSGLLPLESLLFRGRNEACQGNGLCDERRRDARVCVEFEEDGIGSRDTRGQGITEVPLIGSLVRDLSCAGGKAGIVRESHSGCVGSSEDTHSYFS